MNIDGFKRKEPLFGFKVGDIIQAGELYTLAILSIYTIMSIVFFLRIPESFSLILLNLLMMSFIVTLSAACVKMQLGRIFSLFRRLSVIPFIIIIYSQIQSYIPVLNPHLYDDLLIKWDHWLFGVNPTQWLDRFSFPVLTEYLQFCYMLFFLLPIMQGVELHLKREDQLFERFTRLMLFSFFLSYLMYCILPAIGPRFTLHDFSSLKTDLPGIWLTDIFRAFLNTGSSIPPEVANPELFVNRDCMPSGHTWVTLVNIIFAFRYNSKLRFPLLIIGGSLIISTVYLRYHYVVDVIAGIILGIASYITEPHLYSFLLKKGIISRQ